MRPVGGSCFMRPVGGCLSSRGKTRKSRQIFLASGWLFIHEVSEGCLLASLWLLCYWPVVSCSLLVLSQWVAFCSFSLPIPISRFMIY